MEPRNLLRVGLDGRAFDSPAAGIRRYSRELARALIALDVPLTVVALGGAGGIPEGLERAAEPWHPPTNLGWTVVGVMRAARRAALDVYHAPAYTAPPVGVGPMVVTLHDVSYERRPEWYPYHRDRLRRWFYRASARAADLVITDSEFSRREIVAAYGISDRRVRVIPLGVSPSFAPAAAAVALPAGVRQPFLLHVGDLHPRRNLTTAVEATLELRARGGGFERLVLVLAGVDRGSLGELQDRAARGGQASAVLALGVVGEAALVALYRGASALVYPSQYEGFGLPLVEAMACGTPVLAARAATAEEVTADAADLLPVSDAHAWAEAIARVLTSPAHAASLTARGLRRAAAFTWERTARATYDVYCECATGGHDR